MFTKRLRLLRIEKELTQEELGKLLNVTKATISGYEKGIHTPDIQQLAKLAKILDVSVDYLLGITDKRQPYGVVLTDITSLFALSPKGIKELFKYAQYLKSRERNDDEEDLRSPQMELVG